MGHRHLAENFSQTIVALLRALPVGQIASSPIKGCNSDDDLSDVLADQRWHDFDTIAVYEDDRIIGFFQRAFAEGRGNIRGFMDTEPPWPTLDYRESLTAGIRLLAKHDAVLIKKEREFHGIVTRSDLLRMPVRLLCFAFVAQLEMALAETIHRECSGDESKWQHILSPTRWKKLEKRRADLAKRNMEPLPVELLEFCDKRKAVASLLGLPGRFERDLASIERRMRNPVAHASNFLGRDKDVSRLLRSVQAAFHWSMMLRTRHDLTQAPVLALDPALEEIGRALFGKDFEKERDTWN